MGIERQDIEFWNYIAGKNYICLNEQRWKRKDGAG